MQGSVRNLEQIGRVALHRSAWWAIYELVAAPSQLPEVPEDSGQRLLPGNRRSFYVYDYHEARAPHLMTLNSDRECMWVCVRDGRTCGTDLLECFQPHHHATL